MKYAPSEILVALFVRQRIGTHPDDNVGPNWQTFAGRQPDEPDRIITIRDTAPVIEGRIQRTGETIRHPGLQVEVRSDDYAIGWRKIQEIAEFCDTVKLTQVKMGKKRYQIDSLTTGIGPNFVGQDTLKRLFFTHNLVSTIQEI